ncbi:hypothetical protein BO99DRAFT_269043 [Aspergillus violaceofuscus CBS 115571]|uniref:Uncharacterized protein n=1 Tax=Aspergillus violaceofuscus (strain CBS 115571) TaxID=1450538 RepID=A0A2V5GZY3_ASPV1|nr:hypothetical protein BO99DRAFT_269043 [Aspergillus violaceofuscus CBS 115571]
MRWTVISLGVSTGLTGCKPTPPSSPRSTVHTHPWAHTHGRSFESWFESFMDASSEFTKAWFSSSSPQGTEDLSESLDTTGVLSRLFQPPRSSSPAHNIIPSSYIIRGQLTSGQLRSLLDQGVPSCLAWTATPPAQILRPAAVLCGGECCSKWCSAAQSK